MMNLERFPFLIGRIRTRKSKEKGYNTFPRFPFLIGRIRTGKKSAEKAVYIGFFGFHSS